jgi:hypothetical protein
MPLKYEQRTEYDQRRNAAETQKGNDIAPMPKVVNAKRREACRLNLRLFCETYFPAAFKLNWSRDHLKVIAKIESAVLKGGLSAFAMPRGSGKTTIARIASIWAIVYGHRRWVCVIGATDDAAKKLLSSTKKDLLRNEILGADFPHATYPIRQMGGEPAKCRNQHLGGVKTAIEWTADRIVFPHVKGSPCKGSLITVCGITGDIRGQVYSTEDGEVIRPDLVLLDDPQTKESAGSPKQNQDRLDILNGDILGLAGPDVAISGLMACTVIKPLDMAHRTLDVKQSPEWRGELTKLVYAFPNNVVLWDRYFEIREADLNGGGDGALATAFYRENQPAMDDGSDVAWPERFPPSFASAIEFAMVLRHRSPAVFAAEYQNEPIDETENTDLLTRDQIAAKVNGYARSLVPSDTQHLSAFIDVQGKLLYWAVCAWRSDFTGYLVDYGAWPEQRRSYYTLADAVPTIADKCKGGMEAQIFGALTALVDILCGREWSRDGGGVVKLAKCLVDANWGESRDTVYSFCRQSPHAAVLLPTHGRGVKASGSPIHLWPVQPGEKRGTTWVVRRSQKSPIPYGIYDTNFWKSFMHARLFVPMGDSGALSLFKAEPATHRMLADHLHAEYPVPVESQGRKVNEWQHRPDRPDNHLFDCLVGCCVGASMLGAALKEQGAKPAKRKRTLQEMQAAARK